MAVTNIGDSCNGSNIRLLKIGCRKLKGDKRQLESRYCRLLGWCCWWTQMSAQPVPITGSFTNAYIDRTFPAVLGFGAGLAVLQGVFDYTGGQFSGYNIDPQMDEYARKEQMRANKRRPIQETLDQLGEGRGMKQLHTIRADLETLTGGCRHLRTWL